MKRILSSIALLLVIASTFSFAQNVAPSWTNIYKRSGDNSDKFNKIISDGFGNFIAVGYTYRQGNYRDFFTVKFNANGDTLWTRAKNGKGSADDEAITVATDATGNIFVVGHSDEDVKQDDIRLIKYDTAGTVLFDTLYDSPASLDDIPVDMRIDGSGNCIIGGYCDPDTFPGSHNYLTVKYDPNGVLLWAHQYDNANTPHAKDEISAITLDLSDNIYVTGRSHDTTTKDDFVTIKYLNDLTGTEAWVRPYNGGDDDRATAIVTDNAGNIIVTGSSKSGGNTDYRIIKYDVNGNPTWIRTYNSPTSEDDNPTAIAVDASDNVIVTGETDGLAGGLVDFNLQTIKYNSAGTLQWAVRTGDPVGNEYPYDITVDASGNILVVGKSDRNVDPTFVDNDFITVMYNASGAKQWGGEKYYSGTDLGDDDIAFSCVLDGLGNLYVAGGAVDTVTQKDATVVKYDITTGNEVWVRNYNGEGDFRESVSSIVVDANNNSYVAGYTFAENNNLNAILLKLNYSGDTVCSYTFKGIKNDDDEFSDIAIGPNGNIYACGYTKVTDQKSNMLLVKWDPNACDTLWTWTYDYIGQSERAQSIVLDVAGNIYLTGRSDSDTRDTISNYDIVTFKFDSNGNIIWQAPRFNGIGNMKDEPAKIILDNGGNVLVGGRTENVHDDDFIVLKYNSATGNPVWANPAIWASQHTNDDRINDMVVDAFDNIFVCGFAEVQSNPTPNEGIVQKFDSSGTNMATSYLIGDDKDEAVRLAVDVNNNVYALYRFDADGGIPDANNYDILLKKFDNELVELWAIPVQYDSPIDGDDIPEDMVISPAGDIFLTGSSENDSSGGRMNNNWITLGYDPFGVQIFTSNWDGPNATDDAPHAMIIRGPSMWVCGNSEGPNNSQKDITVNEYNAIPVAVPEVGSFKSTCYPNPFSSECKIVINDYLAKSALYLEVFDVLGNVVETPQLMKGNSIIFNRGNLAAGIYQYRIRSNSTVLSHGKMVIN